MSERRQFQQIQQIRVFVSSPGDVANERKLRLRTVRGSVRGSGRVYMRVKLPRAAHQAVNRGRQVTVRLRAKATIGGRIVVTRRTILVARPR